jgi:hypothetical protein
MSCDSLAHESLLNKDPTVWLYGAKLANTCKAVTHTSYLEWCPHTAWHTPRANAVEGGKCLRVVGTLSHGVQLPFKGRRVEYRYWPV